MRLSITKSKHIHGYSEANEKKLKHREEAKQKGHDPSLFARSEMPIFSSKNY